MSSLLAFLAYGIAVAIAFSLSSSRFLVKWYWHVAAVCLALVLGFIHFPTEWAGPVLDIGIGTLFVFLFTFGLVGLIARLLMPKEERRGHHKHA